MRKVTQTQIISLAYANIEEKIKELEEKRNGDKEIDKMIDMAVQPYEEMLESMEMLYEIETGNPMFTE